MIRKFLIAAALLLATPAAFAATCSVNLEGSDAMKYNLSNIDVSKSCKTFTINLKHTGKLARNVMGHNVVVAKSADMAGIDADGMKAGLPPITSRPPMRASSPTARWSVAANPLRS